MFNNYLRVKYENLKILQVAISKKKKTKTDPTNFHEN